MTLILLSLFLSAWSAPASSAEDIVVLDMERAFIGAHLFKARYEKLGKEFQEAQDSINSDIEAVKALENQLKITGKSSPQFEELSEQIEVGKFKIKLAKQRIQNRLKQKNFNMVKDNTDELRQHLKTYCEEKGHKIVLRSIGDDLQGRTGDELRQELNQLNTLYAAPENDITDDFIGWLNAKFEAPKTEKSDAEIEVLE